MDRKDKINALKSILSGNKTPDDLVPEKWYQWNKPGSDEPYRLMNPDPGETKKLFTEEEREAYCSTKHPKHNHLIWKMKEVLNEPL